MHYLISDLSRITGMSIEGIRKYEKEGIIAPQRSENGQYRIYDYLDITSMMRSRMYRALGFSLKETGELINDASLEQAANSLLLEEAGEGLQSWGTVTKGDLTF